MTEATGEIHARLDEVRRRWRRLELIKAVAIGVVEAAGLMMVFMLADWLYAFSGVVRTVLLGGGAMAVIVVLARHLGRALRRQIPDEELALFVEERNPMLQGALLSATEFGEQKGTPLHNYIINVLVAEAKRRVEVLDVRRTVDLGRLRKYALACVVMVAVFVLAGAFFPQFIRRHSQRLLVPWAPEPEVAAGPDGSRDGLFDPDRTGPIGFDITPGDIEILEGGSVPIKAQLTRSTFGLDAILFIKSAKSDWERIPMEEVKGTIFMHAATVEDVALPIEYHVGVGNDESKHYKITVRKRLKVEGLELTTEFPAYLRRPNETVQVYSGDIATLKGSKVTVDVQANQAITEGRLVMGDGRVVPLALTAKGGKTTLAIDKDDTWRYVVKNDKGEEVASDRLFFIQALDDRPPAMEVMEPNNDMTVHPLSEVTCIVNVSEDWALDAVCMDLELIRQGPGGVPERTPVAKDFLPKEWTGRVDGGAAQLVLALEDLEPKLKPGDSIFYHFKVVDRKGQKAVSDIFFISVAAPEVFVFYGEMDWHAPEARVSISPMMQFIAWAWALEQERAALPKDEFLARCRQLAEKMIDPDTGRLVDFIRLGARGDGKGPILPDSDPRKKVAADHTKAGYDLINKGEPGKAVVELKIVWAILKQFFGDASIMLASADMRNPNAVMLEEGESFVQIAQLNRMDMRQMDRELEKLADQQVSWRRKLGRKEMEKVEEARKDIEKLKKDVEQIADAAREEKDDPDGKKPDDKQKRPGDDEKKDGTDEGKKDDGQAREGDREGDDAKTDDEKGDGDTLEQQARRSARTAENLARKLNEALRDQDDRDVKAGLRNLRNAADELNRAVKDIEGKRLDVAENRAKSAHRFLDKAGKDLAKLKFGRLSEMVSAALAHGHRLAERQKKISKATDVLAKKSDEIKTAKKRGDRRATLDEQAMREKNKALAGAQADLSRQADTWEKFVKRMQVAAEEGKEKHVARLLEEGVKAMKRRELPQKMVDAAVEIQQGNLKNAKPPQADASKTIAQVVDRLYRASDALSGTKEGALERAAKRARDVKKKGLELAGLDEKDIPAAAKKDDDKTDDRKDGNDRKDDDKKARDDTELSRRRRQQEASKLWSEVRTLTGDLRSMKAVPKAATDRLEGLTEDDLREMFDRRDRERMQNFISLLARVSKILDEKLLEAQTAKKLESGLRDECPPAYRRLVGRYYSILSAGE